MGWRRSVSHHEFVRRTPTQLAPQTHTGFVLHDFVCGTCETKCVSAQGCVPTSYPPPRGSPTCGKHTSKIMARLPHAVPCECGIGPSIAWLRLPDEHATGPSRPAQGGGLGLCAHAAALSHRWYCDAPSCAGTSCSCGSIGKSVANDASAGPGALAPARHRMRRAACPAAATYTAASTTLLTGKGPAQGSRRTAKSGVPGAPDGATERPIMAEGKRSATCFQKVARRAPCKSYTLRFWRAPNLSKSYTGRFRQTERQHVDSIGARQNRWGWTFRGEQLFGGVEVTFSLLPDALSRAAATSNPAYSRTSHLVHDGCKSWVRACTQARPASIHARKPLRRGKEEHRKKNTERQKAHHTCIGVSRASGTKH